MRLFINTFVLIVMLICNFFIICFKQVIPKNTFNGILGIKYGHDPRLYPGGEKGQTPLIFQKVITQTVTPAQVATIVAAEQDVTVTGVKVGDVLIMNPAATGNATLVGACRVKAADTVSIQYVNPTAGALTPGAGTYTFLIFRPAA